MRCSVHILPKQRGLIQSNPGRGRSENMGEPIVGLVGAGLGVAFIPKDEKGRVKNEAQ